MLQIEKKTLFLIQILCTLAQLQLQNTLAMQLGQTT